MSSHCLPCSHPFITSIRDFKCMPIFPPLTSHSPPHFYLCESKKQLILCNFYWLPMSIDSVHKLPLLCASYRLRTIAIVVHHSSHRLATVSQLIAMHHEVVTNLQLVLHR